MKLSHCSFIFCRSDLLPEVYTRCDNAAFANFVAAISRTNVLRTGVVSQRVVLQVAVAATCRLVCPGLKVLTTTWTNNNESFLFSFFLSNPYVPCNQVIVYFAHIVQHKQRWERRETRIVYNFKAPLPFLAFLKTRQQLIITKYSLLLIQGLRHSHTTLKL